MEINILLREGMGMFLYTTMGMGWEWEYSYGNVEGIESKKSFLHVSTLDKLALNLSLLGNYIMRSGDRTAHFCCQVT